MRKHGPLDSQPADEPQPQYPAGTFWQSNTQQINVAITSSRSTAKNNLYSITIRYIRPEGVRDCVNNAERTITLQQTFAWEDKPIDFKISDDFQVRLAR